MPQSSSGFPPLKANCSQAPSSTPPPQSNYQQAYPCSNSPSIPMLENYIPTSFGPHVQPSLADSPNELAQRLDNLPVAAAAADENASLENRLCQLRDTVQSTALAVLGCARRQHQDRFDDNDAAISNLLAEMNRLHKAYDDRPTDRAAFCRSRRLVQQRLRETQDACTARKAEETQGYLDGNQWKDFFSAIKGICGPPTKGTVPLHRADGSTLLTEKTQIL
ncbi:hypothetical protein SprV_0301103900 [Sparganum proliferum]